MNGNEVNTKAFCWYLELVYIYIVTQQAFTMNANTNKTNDLLKTIKLFFSHGGLCETDVCHMTRGKVSAMTFKSALNTFMFLLQDHCELWEEKMKEKNKGGRLTLFAHGASSTSRTLAAELSAVGLAGPAVQAGMRAAGNLQSVVGLSAAVGYGADRGQRVGGNRCHGGGGGGRERRRLRSRDRGFTPAARRPAHGAWRVAGDEGRGCLRSRVSGGGGGSRRRDGGCGGSGCGEQGERREAWWRRKGRRVEEKEKRRCKSGVLLWNLRSPHELLNIGSHQSLCKPARSTVNYHNWWSECSDLPASSQRCWCLWRPSSASAGPLRYLPLCIWYLQHMTDRRPLRDNPEANRGRLTHYNGSIRKHYVWQVQGLQGALVLHLLLVWITAIIFVTDVCFTGHGGARFNSACHPVWRVWRTLINSDKNKTKQCFLLNTGMVQSLLQHWQIINTLLISLLVFGKQIL